MTYVYVQGPPYRLPAAGKREQVDRFVAAFVAKRGVEPAGDWRVPRVGYCSFFPTPVAHLEAQKN